MLDASQDTPSRLRALVTFRVSELLIQPLPSKGGSAGCGGLDQARSLGIRAGGVKAEVECWGYEAWIDEGQGPLWNMGWAQGGKESPLQ